MTIERILIVDDEPDIRTMLSILLKKQLEAEVETSPDIPIALDLIARTKFDIAFLDISLKKGTGYELIPPLRDRFGDEVKIVMISAFENVVEREKLQSYGADMFVGKPLSTSKIKTALSDLGHVFKV